MIPFGFLGQTVVGSFGSPIMWLKADEGVLDDSGNPCSNGSSIATWTDQTSNNNNATQATSGQRPTFTANIINGYPSLYFPNTNSQQLLIGSMQIGHIFIVASYYNGVFDDAFPGLFNTQDDPAPFQPWLTGNGGTNSLYTTDFDTIYINGTATLLVSDLNNFNLYEGKIAATFTDTWEISGDRNISGRCWNGYIAEVIAYDHTLNDADRRYVEHYLQTKYVLPQSPYNGLPDFSNISRWWTPTSGFDGIANWTDQINGDVMTGGADANSTFCNNIATAIHCADGVGLATSTNFSAPISVYYVSQPISSNGGYHRVMSSIGNDWLLGFWGGNQNEFYFDGWFNSGGGYGAPVAVDGNPHIYGMTTDGNPSDEYAAFAYGDGQGIVEGDTGIAPPNGISIGTGGSFSGEWTECYVGDVLIYNVAHDEDTAISVMNWLNTKYGVY